LDLLSWFRGKGRTVLQDWRAKLSGDKAELYSSVQRELETSYSVFSVVLDEALAMRRQGRLGVARDHLGVSAELCQRFANCLEGMLDSLGRHARHFALSPAFAPLNLEDFLGEKARHRARQHNRLALVVFSRHFGFLHKIRTLGRMTSDLSEEYLGAASEVVEGSSISPEHGWQQLHHLQYDLNTVFRESEIVLKSFLVKLPSNDVRVFRNNIFMAFSSGPAIANRRVAAFRRQ
jgi:hypothetical protein